MRRRLRLVQRIARWWERLDPEKGRLTVLLVAILALLALILL